MLGVLLVVTQLTAMIHYFMLNGVLNTRQNWRNFLNQKFQKKKQRARLTNSDLHDIVIKKSRLERSQWATLMKEGPDVWRYRFPTQREKDSGYRDMLGHPSLGPIVATDVSQELPLGEVSVGVSAKQHSMSVWCFRQQQ